MNLRHSAAHLLAHAVTELYPDTLLTIGPATAEGFFYDFLPTKNFKEEDLPKIAERMTEIVRRNFPLTHTQVPTAEARTLFAHNRFKLELIDAINSDTVGIARQGEFIDLCKGGHVAATGLLGNFKLTGLSGSYWRADRTNQALQRISGIIFPTAEELASYEQQREELLKYDHRKLGTQLDLFSFHDEGVGFPFFHPKGTKILNTLTHYLRTLHGQGGYQEIKTPILLKDTLWKQSGHYAHFKQNMYFCMIDNNSYAVRPMNCPGSILIYRQRPRSYRELPLRLAEFGLVHRHELSGVLNGLFRVRAFTIDDAHIYCTPAQIESEISDAIRLVYTVLKKFNFTDITVAVSTRPADSMGSDTLWEQATNALTSALDIQKIPYEVHPGEGAFYGPKIEFRIKDSLGRLWQCGTIQVDFCQPDNFDLSYVSPQGTFERPVIIHRAIYGSLERFFGILLEHYRGAFPFWLAPVQMRILTITSDVSDYAHTILDQLLMAGFTAEIDNSGSPINAQIRDAQQEKIPWMLVIGKKEKEAQTVTLRTREGAQEFGLTLDQIITRGHNLSNC